MKFDIDTYINIRWEENLQLGYRKRFIYLIPKKREFQSCLYREHMSYEHQRNLLKQGTTLMITEIYPL